MAPPLLERSLDVAVLVAASWPAWGAAASPAFRRAFPVFARWLTACLAAYFVVVGLLALTPFWALRTAAAFALAAMAAVQWHSAVARGNKKGWPAGSLRPLALGPWCNRRFFLDRSRELGPIFKTTNFLRPTACLMGIGEGIDFLKQHEASLGSPGLSLSRFVPGGLLRYMPPDQHARTKAFFQDALTSDVYEGLESFVRSSFRRELSQMADESRQAPDHGVPPRRHLQRVLFRIWARLFFHVDPESDTFVRIKRSYRVIDWRNPLCASDRRIHAELAEVADVIRQQLAGVPDALPETPRSFLDAMARRHPDAVDNPTVIGNLIYLMHFTWSDVSGLLQWLLRRLTEHPEWADRLRREGSPRRDDASPPLSARIVMETLRLEQMEYLYRETLGDITHRGFVIPRGWLVRVCVWESHRDGTVFDDPERFDPDRFVGRTYTRRQYAPFGVGLRHACLGEGLSRWIGGLFVEELVRFDWRTVEDGPPEQGPWRHWRPSSRWRVVTTPSA